MTLLLAAFAAFGATPVSPLAPWRGEFFAEKQGALYVKVDLQGFKSSKQTQFLTGNVQITIENVLSHRRYLLTHKMAAVNGMPRELWKLPAGKYEIRSIVMVDMAGTKRSWLGAGPGSVAQAHKSFSVKRLVLSNLGLWSLRPVGRDGLAVTFGMIPNSYVEEGDKTKSSVVAVIDGFSGLIQEVFAGAKLFKQGESNFSGRNEMRTTVSYTRQVAMFYKLDLFRFNTYAKQIAEVLTVYDANLRNCYTTRLDFNDTLRGEVKFAFILSKQTGTMSKLKYAGGSASDPKLVECMYLELGQIQFPVQENMIGELTYTFDVR